MRGLIVLPVHLIVRDVHTAGVLHIVVALPNGLIVGIAVAWQIHVGPASAAQMRGRVDRLVIALTAIAGAVGVATLSRLTAL